MKIYRRIVILITLFITCVAGVFLLAGTGNPGLRILVFFIFFVGLLNLSLYAKEFWHWFQKTVQGAAKHLVDMGVQPSGGGKPGGNKPSGGKSGGGKPGGNKSGEGRPGGGKPEGDKNVDKGKPNDNRGQATDDRDVADDQDENDYDDEYDDEYDNRNK